MFNWFKKSNKNSHDINKEEHTSTNETTYTSTNEANQLISNWLEKNNIDDLTFENILYQLGLIFNEKVFLEIVPTNVSEQVYNNPNFLGIIKFPKNKENIKKENIFFKYLKEIPTFSSTNLIIYYIELYSNSIKIKINCDYWYSGYDYIFEHYISKWRNLSIEKEYKIKSNNNRTSLEEKEEIYTRNKCDKAYKRTTNNDETKIILKLNETNEIIIKIETNGNKIEEINDKELSSALGNDDILDTLKKVLSRINNNNSFKSINIIYSKYNKAFYNLSYIKDETTKNQKINISKKDFYKDCTIYNRDCTVDNYIENGYHHKIITVNYGNGNKKILKIKGDSEITIPNEFNTIFYLLSSNEIYINWKEFRKNIRLTFSLSAEELLTRNYIYTNECIFKEIFELSFSNIPNNYISIELTMYKNEKILAKNEWKRNNIIHHVVSEDKKEINNTYQKHSKKRKR